MKIKRLDISLFPDSLKDEYDDYVRNWNDKFSKTVEDAKEYVPGSFLHGGYYRQVPEVGRARAIGYYGREPKSFDKWRQGARSLTAIGEQEVIDKINELVKALNELTPKDN